MAGNGFELEGAVEEEIRLAEASQPDEELREPIANWQFDPTDVQRYEVGLHTLLDAVEAEQGSRHHSPPAP
ncbi:hypothetical protein C8D88_1282 [Lentzea atacamensis]|uniref:Uncharacterized protein n=1 Tax=Lentzea atacamensis TaxID=531938 RepID=A0A316HEX0_9PSEU|nr:hypothetical protein [Lentzea atacamensis]PWK78540.1 hypothetical protein C8D88_1282 [Lentzea atacamensis]